MQEEDRAELRRLLELTAGGAWSAGIGISAVGSRRAALRLVAGKGAQVEITSAGRREQLFVKAKRERGDYGKGVLCGRVRNPDRGASVALPRLSGGDVFLFEWLMGSGSEKRAMALQGSDSVERGRG